MLRILFAADDVDSSGILASVAAFAFTALNAVLITVLPFVFNQFCLVLLKSASSMLMGLICFLIKYKKDSAGF